MLARHLTYLIPHGLNPLCRVVLLLYHTVLVLLAVNTIVLQVQPYTHIFN